MIPRIDTNPYVGFSPTILQYAAGMRTDPPVSVPSAPSVISAINAAAEPPDEPAGILSSAQGLRTGRKYVEAEEPPIANSWRLVLPIITVPASYNLRTTSPSVSGKRSSNRALPPVVRTPA